MENTTIIIQGKLEQDSYNFYINKYKNCPVIISTWADCKIDFSGLPKNFKLIIAPLSGESGEQNINYQLISSLNALDNVKTKYNYDNGRLNVSKWKVDGVFRGYINTHAPEERLTKSYLEAKEPDRFEKVDGRILMKEHFSILDIQLLRPYKVKANLFKIEFKDNFIPEKNFSISNIDKLFNDDPYKID